MVLEIKRKFIKYLEDFDMKKLVMKVMLGCALFGVAKATAQNPLSFETDFTLGDIGGWSSHRSRAFVADFNNDGLMDMFWNGTSENKGWQARSVLIKNLGDRQFEGVCDAILEKDTTYNKVYSKDTIWIDKDNDKYELQDSIFDGKVVMDTVVSETFVGMANGLPRTAFGQGSQPIDFNNDGLVDFIILNTGGNDTGTPQGYVLVINKGNWQFEVLEDALLSSVGGLSSNTGGGNFNEDTPYGSLVTGDYDKDGFTDVLLCGNGHSGRYPMRLSNVHGDHFEEAKVFNPLPFDEEPTKMGLFEETDGGLDPETGLPVPGEYTEVPTMRPKQMSHGSVVFIDLDGDGWLDIVTTGYCDGRDNMTVTGVEQGGNQIRFYRNLQNGEFQDVTNSPSLIESASQVLDAYGMAKDGTVADVFRAWGCEEGITIALDFDQDGRTDLMQLGTQGCSNGWGGQRELKQANCLRNISDENGFRLEEIATDITPAAQSASTRFIWVDLNGDDYPDYMTTGWTSKVNPATGEAAGWGRFVDLSDNSTSYNTYFFEDGANELWGGYLAKSGPGVNSFGDFDNDNNMELLTSDYTGSPDNGRNDQQVISWNNSGVEFTAPNEIGEITATAEKGRVLVKWEASEMNNGNDAMFNVYIQNKETGAMRMVVPANIETGKQLSYAMFGCYVNTGNEDGEASYLFDKLPVGEYIVGVQAVNYAYQATAWTTTEVAVSESDYDGVASQAVARGMQVVVDGDAIIVTSADDTQVNIYNMQGAEVGRGMTNEAITVNGKGVFVVKSGSKVAKIVK